MSRPEFTDPYEAARVSSFIQEAALGRWKIERFTVDEERARLTETLSVIDSANAEEARMRMERNVPPGEYVSLRRRAVADEIPKGKTVVYEDRSKFDGWVPIMSDTPSEIHEHDEAIQHASGRVLITGLGLGVVVSALLAKPDVERITVVEIDRDVIGLTGHYYSSHPKVTLVNDDALKYAESLHGGDGSRLGWQFDFAWHDLWSNISERNLDDSLAEHGISYGMILKAYEPFAKRQGAWAYEEAWRKSEVEQAVVRRRQEFIDTWRAGTPEQKAEALIDNLVRDQMGGIVATDESVPDHVRDFFIEHMGLRELAQRVVADNAFDIDQLERDLYAPEPPLAKPNLVEEANIGRR